MSDCRKRDKANKEMKKIFSKIIQRRRNDPDGLEEDDILNILINSKYKLATVLAYHTSLNHSHLTIPTSPLPPHPIRLHSSHLTNPTSPFQPHHSHLTPPTSPLSPHLSHCPPPPLSPLITWCRDGRTLSDGEITGMLIGLLMAGQHTSSTTSAWFGYFVARDQHLQDNLFQEQLNVSGHDLAFIEYDQVRH